MKKFFLMISAALLAIAASAETINVAWPEEPIDATGAEPIALNDGLFQCVGNNSKVTLTKSGFYTGGNSTAEARHIMVFPGYDGTLTVEAAASGDNTDRYVFVSTENAGADETAADVIGSVAIPEKGVRHTFTVPVTANDVFFVCLHGNGTITNLTYTYGEAPAVENFDLTVTNGKEETAIAAGETAEKLSWYFYAAVPAGAEANHDVEAVLTKDGEPFSTARAGMMDETTAYWTFRNAAPDYIQEAGVYTLTIPAGAIYTGEAEAHTSESAAVELSWTVTGVAETHAISVVSVKNGGNEAGVVEYVTGTFEVELAEPISTIGENQAGTMLINTTTNEVYAVSDIIPNGTTAYIRFNIGETSALTAAGVYELQLPEKVLVDEAGNYNEACMGLQWTIEASEYTVINITEVETGVVTDDSWGFNDQHYTATLHFTAPEGAAYAFCEGLQLSLNGEDSNVPFQCGNWGIATLDGSDVALVFSDGMLCATDDPDYDGDLRPYGSYIGEAEIYFMDADYLELPYVAKFTGSLVFENVNKVEAGEMACNLDMQELQLSDLEANGIVLSFPEAKNVTPEMTVKVVASLISILPGGGAAAADVDGDDDPGFGLDAEYTEVVADTEFYGDAMFGTPSVNLAAFTEFILGNGSGIYGVVVKNVEIISNVGVEYSWAANDEEAEQIFVVIVTENEPVDPTAISNILAGQNNVTIYNLQGQRINAAKGMVIANGKKAIVK